MSQQQKGGSDDLDAFIEQYHRADAEFVKGNPEPCKMIYSHWENATLANPFGPVSRGWKQVAATMDRAASFYSDGEILGYDSLAKYETPELSYIVEVVRLKAKMAGTKEVAPAALRATSVLRREDGAWKVVHRHADPITTLRPPESVVGK